MNYILVELECSTYIRKREDIALLCNNLCRFLPTFLYLYDSPCFGSFQHQAYMIFSGRTCWCKEVTGDHEVLNTRAFIMSCHRNGDRTRWYRAIFATKLIGAHSPYNMFTQWYLSEPNTDIEAQMYGCKIAEIILEKPWNTAYATSITYEKITKKRHTIVRSVRCFWNGGLGDTVRWPWSLWWGGNITRGDSPQTLLRNFWGGQWWCSSTRGDRDCYKQLFVKGNQGLQLRWSKCCAV